MNCIGKPGLPLIAAKITGDFEAKAIVTDLDTVPICINFVKSKKLLSGGFSFFNQ